MLKSLILAPCAAILFGLVMLGTARAQDNCRGFIDARCCCTNACCWEVQSFEVQPLPGDRWRIISTGQDLHRTAFSPDGKYYRCACDRDEATGNWIRHQGARTRCIYVPPNLF